MKQFLLHLDETMALGQKFILQDLDETHVFVSSDVPEKLKVKLDELMEQNSYSFAASQAGQAGTE